MTIAIDRWYHGAAIERSGSAPRYDTDRGGAADDF